MSFWYQGSYEKTIRAHKMSGVIIVDKNNSLCRFHKETVDLTTLLDRANNQTDDILHTLTIIFNFLFLAPSDTRTLSCKQL